MQGRVYTVEQKMIKEKKTAKVSFPFGLTEISIDNTDFSAQTALTASKSATILCKVLQFGAI